MRYFLLLALTAILFTNCNNSSEKKETIKDSDIPSDTSTKLSDTATSSLPDLTEANLLSNAKTIVQLIKDGNFSEIAKYVSPAGGLGISSNGFIEKNDINFPKEKVAGLWTDQTKYKFPSYADEEDVTKITFREFYKSDIYDKDFITAKDVSLNKVMRGPTPSMPFNINETYAKGAFVDFYIPAPKEMELDWATLRLIFVNENGNWWLRHLVHDNWTP